MEMCLYIQLFHSLKRSRMKVGAVLKRETGVQVNKMLIIPNCRLTCLHYVNFSPQNVMNCTLQRIILSNLKQSNLKH